MLPIFWHKTLSPEFLGITHELLLHGSLEVLLFTVGVVPELLPAEHLLLPGEAHLLPQPGGLLGRGAGGVAGQGEHGGEAGGDGADPDPQCEVVDVIPAPEQQDWF